MAQPVLRRVGFLGISTPVAASHLVEALKHGMRELGWREGSNVEYRFGFAGSDANRLDNLVAELIEQKVELIVAPGNLSVRAAQRATKTIPIVMTNVANAVGLGFVASLARPGGNITGISAQQEEALGKLVEILHEAAPRARRVAFLINESNPSSETLWAAARAACAKLTLVAVRVGAKAPGELAAVVGSLVRLGAQAVVVPSDGMFLAERTRLQELLAPVRLPVAHQYRDFVAAGGLLSYAADLEANFRYAAKFVDKILRGAKPADLPVEQPTQFQLVLNLKTAKALGLTVPNSVRQRADKIIE